MEAPPAANGKEEKLKRKSSKKVKGSLIGSLVRKDPAEMERKARKKAGKQEKKQEKKVAKLQKKERKAEAKGSAMLNAEAVALRTTFDQFILAHRPIRRPGTHWEYLDVKTSSVASTQLPPFVFLPPGALRPEAYFELLTRMSQRCRVLAVVFPSDFTSLADYVAGVELILSHASIGKAHFFGIGFGGFVAHQLLAQRPELFLSLALASCSAPDPDLGKVIRRIARAEHVEKKPELLAYFAGFGEKLRVEPEVKNFNDAESEFWLHVVKNFGVGKKRASELLPRFEACATYHLETRFEANQFPALPVLLIDANTQDRSAAMKTLTKLHSQAQTQLYPNASHLYVLLCARSVVERLNQFYASVAAQMMVPAAAVEWDIHISGNGKSPREEEKDKKEKKSKRKVSATK